MKTSFSPPRPSVRCRFGQETFADVSSDGEDAPLPAVRGTRWNREESRFLRPAGEHVFLDLSARSEAIFVPASGNQAL
jgi:hypothetical protein